MVCGILQWLVNTVRRRRALRALSAGRYNEWVAWPLGAMAVLHAVLASRTLGEACKTLIYASNFLFEAAIQVG